MSKPDFQICFKESLSGDTDWSTLGEWDLFISGFNSSERVRTLFTRISAKKKYWLVFPDYGYGDGEYPVDGEVFADNHKNEADYIGGFMSKLPTSLGDKGICVDITGFMRPHLLYLVRALKDRGVSQFDAFYSEPRMYQKKEETSFSDGPVYEVRQIAGFEGHHNTDTANDVLIVAAGYDHDLIRHVVESKSGARVVQIFGLPSLSAAMYQEAVIRAARAADSMSGRLASNERYFCSANDPFGTASYLRGIKRKLETQKPITNLYLSPLATKPQVLGFALFYLADLQGEPASIIFPFCNGYSRETSIG